MKYAGAHVSASGGVFNAPLNASEIGAKSFAFFTRNQKRWHSPPFKDKDIALFKENLEKSGIKPDYVLPHDSYLINLGNPDPVKRKKSYDAFTDELVRVEQLGLKYLNFHPGSHLKEVSEDECIEIIALSLNDVFKKTDNHNTVAVIENTAGQGTNIGNKFEHLKAIIDLVDNKERIGVCLDTCHTYSAGYDIKTEKGFKNVMDDFDSIVGFKYLCGMHLNDSKKVHGSRVDRHDSLGKGTLGLDPFRLIMNDPRFENIPLILETPDSELWESEIKLLYSLEK